MFNQIFFAVWFFLPVGLATLGAFASAKIPGLKKLAYPVDFYLKFRGKRIFGSHKTIRGFIIGILVAILTVYVQIYLYEQLDFIRNLVSIDYTTIDPITFGFL